MQIKMLSFRFFSAYQNEITSITSCLFFSTAYGAEYLVKLLLSVVPNFSNLPLLFRTLYYLHFESFQTYYGWSPDYKAIPWIYNHANSVSVLLPIWFLLSNCVWNSHVVLYLWKNRTNDGKKSLTTNATKAVIKSSIKTEIIKIR